jgi:putative ABC transport system permease protein
MIFQDLRHAMRHLMKAPGFTATAVLTLGLGIGATTAVFSIVEAVLLRPLPFRDPSRLVVLADNLEGVSLTPNGESVSGPDLRAYTRDTHTFEGMGVWANTTYELSSEGEPVQINAARLTGGIFPTLGVAPLLGRVFNQEEDDQGQQVTVLSYSLWQSRFHGDRSVLGSKLLLDRKPYVVIGVMPREFEFPLLPGRLNQSQLWVPMTFTKAELADVGSWSFQIVARLKRGVSLAQGQADAEQVAQEIMRNYPPFMTRLHISAVVRPLQEDTVAQARPLVRVLFLAVLVVLLIACANLAGLLLVRAIRRRREIAVRLALGARLGTLLRQTIVESLVLSISGGLLGLIIASATLHVSLALIPETLPRVDEIRLDWAVVAFAMLLAVATGVLCGLAPAFAAVRTNLNDGLKEGGRTGSSGSGHARLRSTLVVAEIAVALVLLAASGLLLRSFEKMRAVDPGFRPERTVVASYALPRQKYSSQSAVDEFNHELVRRLEQLPGADSAGLTSFIPMSGQGNQNGFIAEGFVPPKGANISLATISFIVGDYCRAMGIPLLRGRSLTEADKAGAQLVILVNRKLAEHYWPGQDPIGKRLRVGTPELQSPWLTIVGEVANVKQDSADVETEEQYYQPVEQFEASLGQLASAADINGNTGYIVLRSPLPPEQMENSLRATVRALDPQLALAQIQTMEQAVSDTEAPRRFNTAVITAFALGAILLAVIGIYSVIAFTVAQRTQEMAIRMALGSPRIGIVRMILGSGARLGLIGCGIGLVGAIAASRLLSSLLFQVSALDPLVMTLASAAVLLLAIGASTLPARRAASIDPMQALRMD